MPAASESQGRAAWGVRDLLPWWPVAVGTVSVIVWAVTAWNQTNQVLIRMTEVQSNIASIQANIATLPQLTANVTYLNQRITALEKSQETQDERIGRVGDALGAIRNDVNDVRGEVRAITRASQVPLPAPGRSPR